MDLKKLIRNKTFIIAVSIVLVAGMGISAYLLLRNNSKVVDTQAVEEIDPSFNPGSITISPSISDTAGVDKKSEFKILCERDIEEQGLKKYLTVRPEQKFNVRPLSGREYLLSFEESLKSDSIYRFGIRGPEGDTRNSWAFQTKKELKALRSLPRNQATNVPVNTGIEVTFSHDGIEDAEKYFEISPRINGRFELHGKVLVFVPEKLEEGTVYSVKIKKGLKISGSENGLAEDFAFSFQTLTNRNAQGEKYIEFAKALNNFTSNTVPYLELYADNTFLEREVNVEVLKYSSENAFMENMRKYDSLPRWAYLDSRKIVPDTSKTEKVAEYKTKIFKDGGYSWEPQFIVLPSTLPEGHYLVSVKADERELRTHLQVNNSAAYVLVSQNGTIVWVNDTTSSKPVQGARIEMEGKDPAETDKDGIAMIPGTAPELKQSRNFNIKVARQGKPTLLADVESGYNYYYNASQGSESLLNSYWNYLYTDRGMYMPNDTVRLWGIAKPRDEKEKTDKVVIRLGKFGVSGIYGRDLDVLDSTERPVNEMGTYYGEFKLENLLPGNYIIEIMVDGKHLSQKYIEVKQYTKPAYKIDIKKDRDVIRLGESVNIDIQAGFFEGTPVPGIGLSYNMNNYYSGPSGLIKGDIVCDDSGSSRLTFSSEFKKEQFQSSWRPKQFYLNVMNKQAEEEEIRSSTSVIVFPSDMMIKTKSKKVGNLGAVEINTNAVDISGLKDPSNNFNEESYKGRPVDASLNVKIYEKWWEKKENGDYYDFINKVVQKRYTYTEKQALVKEAGFRTSNGSYVLNFPAEDRKTYYAVITGADSKGFEISETAYVNTYDYYSSINERMKNYTVVPTEGKDSFHLGDMARLEVMENGNRIPENAKDSTLFIQMKNGILGHSITGETGYSFEFNKQHIPDIFVKAVYFDGTYLYSANTKMLKYDYSEQELKIELKTGKKQYRPGENVDVEISVKDMKGKPVSSDVNISVVDEAFFAVRQQKVNTLEELYSYSFTSGELSEYRSHIALKPRFGMAECGEGGDSGQARTDFRDNAFFATARSDENGKGKASFKLPDNITSWRLTYQGVSGDLKAGSGKLNIDATLPFFVNMVFNDVFLEGDRPSLAMRTFGTELKSGADIEYSVVLEGENGFKRNYSAKGKSNSFTRLQLDKLGKGKYSITAEALNGGSRDAMKREFKVADSILEAARLEHYKLEDGLKIKGGERPASLIFYNSEASDYFRTLCSLRYTWGQRVDQKLSRKIAGELYKKYFGDGSYWYDEEADIRAYQQNDGGIALLTYDSSSPEITAKAAALAPDYFDRDSLKVYFYRILDSKSLSSDVKTQNKINYSADDMAAAFWGLASLNEPVLLDIKSYLKLQDLSDRQKLYLCMALAQIGDYTGAAEVYGKVTADRLKTQNPYIYMDTGSKDSIMEATSMCAIISARLGLPERNGLFKYVNENSTGDILLNFERLIYVANSIPSVPSAVKFTYELGGKKEEVTLDRNKRLSMLLTPNKLKDIKFSNIKGGITVSAAFTGPVKDMLNTQDGLVKLSRSYSVEGKTATSFKQSDFVKVTLIPEFAEAAPDGYYEVADVLPSGLKYTYPRPGNRERWSYGRVDGQRVIFGYSYGKFSPRAMEPIVYNARVIMPGEYTADNAFIKHSKSDVWGYAERSGITVGE